MKFHRIYGMFLRYTFLMRRNFDRITDAFYWPTLDLLIWGLTSLYIQELAQNGLLIKMVLTCLICWYIVYRIQGDITINLLEEYWNHNLVNIFVSPLTFSEWMAAMILNGFLKTIVTFVYAGALAFLLYHVGIFSLGWYLLPYAFLLVLTGWAFGFFIAGLILRYGLKIQTIAWTLVYVIFPFSAVFYPVSVLPEWIHPLVKFIPSSYVFEGLRQAISTQTFNLAGFYTSLVLNILYLAAIIVFLRFSFHKALNRGLISVR